MRVLLLNLSLDVTQWRVPVRTRMGVFSQTLEKNYELSKKCYEVKTMDSFRLHFYES